MCSFKFSMQKWFVTLESSFLTSHKESFHMKMSLVACVSRECRSDCTSTQSDQSFSVDPGQSIYKHPRQHTGMNILCCHSIAVNIDHAGAYDCLEGSRYTFNGGNCQLVSLIIRGLH